MVAIPQSGLLAQVSSLRLPSGHSGLVLTLSNAARASLPSPCLLVVGAGICAASPLGELPLGTQSVGFNYLFLFPPSYVALCCSKARHRLSSESVSWCLETSFLRLPSQGFPGGSDGKASACSVRDPGSIPGSGRSPGEGNGNPLQHSCLENPMDGGA